MIRSPTGELSEAMRRIQNEYSRFFNRRHRRDGTLIRGRFRSKRVESVTYQRVLVGYIDFNPVRARIVRRSWEFPWGSARAYVASGGPRWMERSWVEQQMARSAARSSFRPGDYLRLFGSAPTGATELVEHRIEHRASTTTSIT